MKKGCLLLFVMFISFISNAQKIDLDRVPTVHHFVKLPIRGKLLVFDTYKANPQIDQTIISQLRYTGNKIETFYNIHGYGFSNDVNGFTYTIKVEKAKTIKKEVTLKKVDTKNQAGQVITLDKYIGTIHQTVPTTLLVTNSKTGEEIYKVSFGGVDNPYIATSQLFDKKDEADVFCNVADGSMNYTVLQAVTAKIDSETDKFRVEMSTKVQEEKLVLWNVNIEKAPGYEQFNSEVENARKLIDGFTYNQSVETFRQEIAPLITSWRDANSKIQLEGKMAKKLRYAYLINIARCQFVAELYDDCSKTAQEIIDNGYDKGDGRELIEMSADAKKEIATAETKSKHQNRLGYSLTSKYEYGSMFVQDLKNIKQAGVEAKDATKTFLKETVLKKNFNDTLSYTDTDLSSLTYTLNGEVKDLGFRLLSTGYAEPFFANSTDENKKSFSYFVSLDRRNFILKKGDFVGFYLNIFPNKTFKGTMTADSLMNHLKKYSKTPIRFLNTDIRPKLNDDSDNPKYIELQNEIKNLNGKPYIKATITYQKQRTLIDEVVSDIDLVTRKPQSANVEIVSVTPVKMKAWPRSGMSKIGYQVVMKISQLEFQEAGNMEYQANLEHVEVFKDIKVAFIMVGY